MVMEGKIKGRGNTVTPIGAEQMVMENKEKKEEKKGKKRERGRRRSRRRGRNRT